MLKCFYTHSPFKIISNLKILSYTSVAHLVHALFLSDFRNHTNCLCESLNFTGPERMKLLCCLLSELSPNS